MTINETRNGEALVIEVGGRLDATTAPELEKAIDGKDYDVNSEFNAAAIPSCYFTITVKDTVSGLSETIRVWLVTSVKSVSLDKTSVSI